MKLEIDAYVLWLVDKKLNKRGAITIPVSIRRNMELEGGDKFTVYQLSNGDLYLKRLTGRCCMCGKMAYKRTAAGHFLCDSCAKEEGVTIAE